MKIFPIRAAYPYNSNRHTVASRFCLSQNEPGLKISSIITENPTATPSTSCKISNKGIMNYNYVVSLNKIVAELNIMNNEQIYVI
jgi:hypothetical protein